MKITITETSGATFTSSRFESTLETLIKSGHEITAEDESKLSRGESVTIYKYNLAGVATKRTLRKI